MLSIRESIVINLVNTVSKPVERVTSTSLYLLKVILSGMWLENGLSAFVFSSIPQPAAYANAFIANKYTRKARGNCCMMCCKSWSY